MDRRAFHLQATHKRSDDLEHALFPLRMAPLDRNEAMAWKVRYFDSLSVPRVATRTAAQSFIDLVNSPGKTEPLERENTTFQADAFSCGYWVRHWMEEMMRRHRGEGMWPQRKDDGCKHYCWLNGIRTKFRSSLTEGEAAFVGESDFH